MTTRKTKKLSELQTITTADGNKMIPVVDGSGNVNPIKLSDLAQVVSGLISEATLANKGLMGTYDKSFMPYPFPAAGSRNFLIADIARYQRFTSLIITSPNNSETAGLFILNAGNGATPTPGLKKIIGDRMAGRIFYKLDETRMKIYYQCPSSEAGSIDIFVSLQNQNGLIKYSEYSGSTEDMTEIVLSD